MTDDKYADLCDRLLDHNKTLYDTINIHQSCMAGAKLSLSIGSGKEEKDIANNLTWEQLWFILLGMDRREWIK